MASAASAAGGRWRRFARVAWFAVPPLVFVKDRWVWVYCVDGRSMSPTLNPQETFIDRCFRDVVLVFRNAEFQKGDVVVLRDPTSNYRIVKRMTAQGNEFVRKDEGGFAYVPPGHCWVEGDNPLMSVDSRTFNAVPLGLLDALVVAVVWPFWRARWLDIAEVPEEPSFEPFLPTTTGDDVDVGPDMQVRIAGLPAEVVASLAAERRGDGDSRESQPPSLVEDSRGPVAAAAAASPAPATGTAVRLELDSE